jgi:hypothetical protein
MRLALKFEKLRVEVELAETATTRMLTQALPFRIHSADLGRGGLEKDACQVVLGKIVGDPRRLAAVKAGESVTVEKA